MVPGGKNIDRPVNDVAKRVAEAHPDEVHVRRLDESLAVPRGRHRGRGRRRAASSGPGPTPRLTAPSCCCASPTAGTSAPPGPSEVGAGHQRRRRGRRAGCREADAGLESTAPGATTTATTTPRAAAPPSSPILARSVTPRGHSTSHVGGLWLVRRGQGPVRRARGPKGPRPWLVWRGRGPVRRARGQASTLVEGAASVAPGSSPSVPPRWRTQPRNAMRPTAARTIINGSAGAR